MKVFWKKYRHMVIAFAVACLVSFALLYAANYQGGATRTATVEENLVGEETVVLINEQYAYCGHLVPAEYGAALNLRGLTRDQLQDIFLEELGWQVKWQDPRILNLTRVIEGFCPEDAGLSHLDSLAGYVAIYQGPATSKQVVKEVTKLPVNNLPEEWRAKLGTAELQFGSEQELNNTLDSLDEFQN